MPSLKQIHDSDLPPGLISPIYSVWNPMVFVHLINLIKIFGALKKNNKKKNETKKATKLDLYVAGGQSWEQIVLRKVNGEIN